MNRKLVTVLSIFFLLFSTSYMPANASMGGKKGKVSPCLTNGNSKAQAAILKSRIKQIYCVTDDPTVDPKLMYVVSISPLTWEGARLTAISIGGQLTGIRSTDEQNYVNLMNSLNGYSYYWIGGYDLPNDGTWTWQDTGQLIATGFYNDPINPLVNAAGVYTNWLSGEPNNPGSTEVCLHGWWDSIGAWNNINCGTQFNEFVMRLN